MAGSNYSVNITLNTAKAEQKLKMLEKRVSTFRQNLAKPLRIETQTQKLQEKKLKNLDDQKASMIETRRIGDKLRDAESKGLKVDKAKAAIRKAAVLDSKNMLKASSAQRKIALDELRTEQKTTEELAKQLSIKLKSGAFAGGSNFGMPGGGGHFTDPYDFAIPGESNVFSSQFSSQANGGAIASNTNALLMGGEYVLSSAAASRIGRSNLDDINMGRYSNGGPVGAGISDSSSSGGGVGEVNITINMEKGDASVDENSNGDADPTQTKEFAKRIKDVVVGVINEVKRVSGSLFTRRK